VECHSRTIRLPVHVAQKADSRPDLATVVMSTDALVGDDEDTRLIGLIPDPCDLELETVARVDTEALLAQLRPKEQLILRRRFGLDTGQMESLKEIGTSMGITREGVRQLQNKALAKLRKVAARGIVREQCLQTCEPPLLPSGIGFPICVSRLCSS
jgi:RNA polymerase sigma factor (sigma-70 family)